MSLTGDLEKLQSQKSTLQVEIDQLEAKTAALRKKSPESPNVFEEISLKNTLNDLKQKLEENSNLQRHWVEKQG